ncbi:MAG: hypothetical protein Q9198_011047, partial [Flavoplaca austrocitrina]
RYLSQGDQVVLLASDGTSLRSGPSSEFQDGDEVVDLVKTEAGVPSKDSDADATKQRLEHDIQALPDQDKDKIRGHGSEWAVFKYYARSIGYAPLVLFFVAQVAYAFCSIFPQLWVK